MALIAVEYEILRDVKCSCLEKMVLARRPVRVATMINEQKFVDSGGAMNHLDTVFFEDKMHDWSWENGEFRFYSRVDTRCDVLVVYTLEERRFDPMTGKPLEPTRVSSEVPSS